MKVYRYSTYFEATLARRGHPSHHSWRRLDAPQLPIIPVLRRNLSTNTPTDTPAATPHLTGSSGHRAHSHQHRQHSHHKHKRLYANLADSTEPTRDGDFEMMRSNSYSNKNGNRYTGGAGGAADDERDQLLTPAEHRSGAGGSGSDLEIGNHAENQRKSNKKGKHNRRNSNGLLGFSRRSESRQMAGKERTLCLVATSLFIVLTIVLLIAARAIPNPFDRNPYLDPTDPNDPHQNPGNGGKGGPHVVVPIGGPQLPPPTDLPRNDAFLVKAEKGAVASEDVDCSKMGVDVLKEGGNAVVSTLIDPKDTV